MYLKRNKTRSEIRLKELSTSLIKRVVSFLVLSDSCSDTNHFFVSDKIF